MSAGLEPVPAPKKAHSYPGEPVLEFACDINMCWSLDFTSDLLTDGRQFRTLNVLDDYKRQLLGVEIYFSLPAICMVQTLKRLAEYHGCPVQLRTDNSPGFISARLGEWCKQQGIILHWIQPGKTTQNAYIERLNCSFRRELLNAHLFRSLATCANS